MLGFVTDGHFEDLAQLKLRITKTRDTQQEDIVLKGVSTLPFLEHPLLFWFRTPF